MKTIARKFAFPALLLLGAVPAFHCPFAQAAAVTARVSDAAGEPLGDAVVYAMPTSGQTLPKTAKATIIDQVNKEFTPLVTPMQLGTMVTFPNKDNIRHHVYSFSPAKVFSIKLYSGIPAEPVLFDKPGEVVLGCNIHDNMLAFVYVVDTPYFAKTGKDGVARLESMVAGDYDIRAWHHGQQKVVPAQPVKLTADARQELAMQLEIAPRSPPKAGEK